MTGDRWKGTGLMNEAQRRKGRRGDRGGLKEVETPRRQDAKVAKVAKRGDDWWRKCGVISG